MNLIQRRRHLWARRHLGWAITMEIWISVRQFVFFMGEVSTMWPRSKPKRTVQTIIDKTDARLCDGMGFYQCLQQMPFTLYECKRKIYVAFKITSQRRGWWSWTGELHQYETMLVCHHFWHWGEIWTHFFCLTGDKACTTVGETLFQSSGKVLTLRWKGQFLMWPVTPQNLGS